MNWDKYLYHNGKRYFIGVFMITVSVIKADIGGHGGHSRCHPEVLDLARQLLQEHKGKDIVDFYVTNCGDDMELILTHHKGVDNEEIHKMAWDIFWKGTEKAKELKLYGAGQDLLKDSFAGNLKGMGPGFAEMEFEERTSEPIVVFMADKTEPGAWNLPLYKMFGDPFNTAGLVIDPKLHTGFIFEVQDVIENKQVKFSLPEDTYQLLALIGHQGRYVVKRVFRKSDNEIASVSSTEKLNLAAGKYVGKDDPVMIVRGQSGFPAIGEILEPFSFPYLVAGWMRGSHHGPIMPTSVKHACPTRFDGPPRVIALGFQLCEGMLGLPIDFFDSPCFEHARQQANHIADYMRRHGTFEPARLSSTAMEYTTLPDVMKKLDGKWEEDSK
jgi:fructose 1,6-bisphosphate aldolase/phosphatase